MDGGFSRVPQVALVVKNRSANAGDKRGVGLIPGLERSPGEGNGNSLWYSCLENSKDRGAWWATVHRVTKSGTLLKRRSTQACMGWGSFARAPAWVSIFIKQSLGLTSLPFVLECFLLSPLWKLESCAILAPGYTTSPLQEASCRVSGSPLVCECHSQGTSLPKSWENLDSSRSFAAASLGLSGKPLPLP